MSFMTPAQEQNLFQKVRDHLQKSIPEIAEMLGISRQWASRLRYRDNKKLPEEVYHQLSNLLLLPKEDNRRNYRES